jgi:hypothetical protein
MPQGSGDTQVITSIHARAGNGEAGIEHGLFGEATSRLTMDDDHD